MLFVLIFSLTHTQYIEGDKNTTGFQSQNAWNWFTHFHRSWCHNLGLKHLWKWIPKSSFIRFLRLENSPTYSIIMVLTQAHTYDHIPIQISTPSKVSKQRRNRRKDRPKLFVIYRSADEKYSRDNCVAFSSLLKSRNWALKCNFHGIWIHCHCDTAVL